MIQMLDPPGVWGLSRRGLHFLLKNRRNKRKDIKKGAFSIARHRNLRGLDLVCINATFSVKNVILKRMKTVRGRIDANPDSEEKPKNEKRKFEQGQFNTTSSPASLASQLASKSASQKTVKPTTSKQPAAHHHNTATQQANHPADQLAETSQRKASSSNHPVIQSAIEPTQSRAP